MKKKFMNKIIFIMPPKDWFLGVDHINSERMIKYFQDNKIFNVYKFKDIDIFLKDKLGFKDFLKLIYYYFFFKIKKKKYVFAVNASYIAYCNLVFKTKTINFFSQILNIKCILKWDHIQEQVPNIVENILKKFKFYKIDDYKKFFLEKINNENFFHYTWQKEEYFCKKNYLENILDLKGFQLEILNFFFTYDVKKNIFLQKSDNNKKIALVGFMNKVSQPETGLNNLSFILKDKKNFFNKRYYESLINYCNYEYSKKKIDLMQTNNFQFYGIDLIENSGKIVDANNFYSEISKFFIIINPINPIALTLSPKFYFIYLYGGFCINELPPEIPSKLEKFKDLIFYKNKSELNNKIEYFKENLPVYFSIKKEINKISKDLQDQSYKDFINEIKKI